MTKPVLESPGRYTKKPVTIEAMPFTDGNLAARAVTDWMEENGCPWLIGNALEPDSLRPRGGEDDDDKPTAGMWIDPASGSLMIRTLEGDMRVSFGDYVIKGIQGEFYPCKPDIFAASYAPDDGSGILVIPPGLMENIRNSDYDVTEIRSKQTTVSTDWVVNPFTLREQLVTRVEHAVDITAERKHG
jgi:hypothetical protein